MKLKINKRTIETILWLLGQLITLMREVAKNNKGSEEGDAYERSADTISTLRNRYLKLKLIKSHEDHEQKESERKAKGD